MSHSNGFEFSPNFKLINGRDYYIVKQLYDIVKKGQKKAQLFYDIEKHIDNRIKLFKEIIEMDKNETAIKAK